VIAYKFYYWVAWPAISFSIPISVSKITPVSAELDAIKVEDLASQFTQLKEAFPDNSGYFLIEKETCKIVKLAEYSIDCKYFLAFLDSSNNPDNPGISYKI
jgi:hypothetical protein